LPSVVADDSTVLAEVNGEKIALKIRIYTEARQKCRAFFVYE
jgi:outer membrane usher protein FimD/PapC